MNVTPQCNISVAISVKDRHAELRQTVTSVYQQTCLPTELIIVDDCSTPPISLAQLPEAPKGLKVQLFRNDTNLGGAASLNRAVLEAQCSLIAFLDSDDVWLPNYLANVSELWSSVTTETVCVATGFYWCTENLIPYRVQIAPTRTTRQDILIKGNNIGGSSVLSVRRDVFLKKGGYPLLRGHHDTGLLLRLTQDGTIQTIQKPLILYRSPTTNTQATYTKKYRKQLLAVFAVYKMHSKQEKLLMLPRIRKMIFYLLINMGKRRMAWKVLRSIFSDMKAIDLRFLKLIIPFLVGPRAYDSLLFYYAHLRARMLGNLLLRQWKE